MKRICDKCGWQLPGKRGHGLVSSDGKSIVCPECPEKDPKKWH